MPVFWSSTPAIYTALSSTDCGPVTLNDRDLSLKPGLYLNHR